MGIPAQYVFEIIMPHQANYIAMRIQPWTGSLLPAVAIITLALVACQSPWAAVSVVVLLGAAALTLSCPYVLVILLAMVLPISRAPYVGFYLRPYHAVALVALPMLLWYRAAGKIPALRLNWADLSIVAFLTCCLLSFSASSDIYWSMRKSASLIWLVLLYIAIRGLLHSKEALRKAINAAGLSMGLLAIGGLIVMLLFITRQIFTELVPIPAGLTPRLAYLHTDPNFYGMYVGIYLIFALVFLLRYPTVNPWLKGVLILLLCTNFILAFSRGAFLALAAVLPLGLFIFRRHISRRAVLLTALLLGLVVLAIIITVPQWLWLPQWNRLVQTPVQIITGKAPRIAQLGYAWQVFGRHPLFGVGIGVSRTWYYYLRYAHNMFLEIMLDTGIVGLIGYLLMIGSVVTMGVRAYRRTSDDYLKTVLGAVLIALTFFHLQALTLNTLQDVMLWAMMGLIVATAVVVEKQNKLLHSSQSGDIDGVEVLS